MTRHIIRSRHGLARCPSCQLHMRLDPDADALAACPFCDAPLRRVTPRAARLGVRGGVMAASLFGVTALSAMGLAPSDALAEEPVVEITKDTSGEDAETVEVVQSTLGDMPTTKYGLPPDEPMYGMPPEEVDPPEEEPGELTSGDVKNGIMGRWSDFSDCLTNADKEGTMKVAFTIMSDGTVTESELMSEDFVDTEVAACVLEVVDSLTFPENTNDGLKVTFPFAATLPE